MWSKATNPAEATLAPSDLHQVFLALGRIHADRKCTWPLQRYVSDLPGSLRRYRARSRLIDPPMTLLILPEAAKGNPEMKQEIFHQT